MPRRPMLAESAEVSAGAIDPGRLHAFGAATSAVAAGLLVVELVVPRPGMDVWGSLGQELPTFATFAVSVVLVIAVWLRYGVALTLPRRIDRTVLALTTLLLLGLVALGFPTALLGRALAVDAFARSAALLYAGVVTAVCGAGAALEAHVVRHAARLRVPQVPPTSAVSGALAPATGLVAVGLSLVDARLGLGAAAVLAVGLLLVPRTHADD